MFHQHQSYRLMLAGAVFLGWMAAQSANAASAPSYTETYTYDALGRVTVSSQSGVGDVEEYAYDPAGNRLTKTLPASSFSGLPSGTLSPPAVELARSGASGESAPHESFPYSLTAGDPTAIDGSFTQAFITANAGAAYSPDVTLASFCEARLGDGRHAGVHVSRSTGDPPLLSGAVRNVLSTSANSMALFEMESARLRSELMPSACEVDSR